MEDDMSPEHCDGNVTNRILKDAPKEVRLCCNINIITVSTFKWRDEQNNSVKQQASWS